MSAAEIRTALVRAEHGGARLEAEPPSAAAGAGPARYWRLEGPHGVLGRFGIISAMTEHFCDTCNRVRLSASGALHTCLAHDDTTDLRAALHAGGEQAVTAAIRGCRRRQARRTFVRPAGHRGTAQGNDSDRRLAAAAGPSASCGATGGRRMMRAMPEAIKLDTAAIRARAAGARAAFEERLAALVEIPSVSMDPERAPDMNRCAALARELLVEAGRARRRDRRPAGAPLVLGRVMRNPIFPTVTIYNHLDVQPADPAEWRSPAVHVHAQGRALLRARRHRRQGSGAGGAVRRAPGARDGSPREHPVLVGAGGGDRQPELRARSGRRHRRDARGQGRRGRAVRDRIGGRVRHHLDRRGEALHSLRPARADGVHGLARDRQEGRPLGHHRRRRPQPAHRAGGPDRRVRRRPHRPGEDSRVLQRCAQADRRRAGGLRARRVPVAPLSCRPRASQPAAAPRANWR